VPLAPEADTVPKSHGDGLIKGEAVRRIILPILAVVLLAACSSGSSKAQLSDVDTAAAQMQAFDTSRDHQQDRNVYLLAMRTLAAKCKQTPTELASGFEDAVTKLSAAGVGSQTDQSAGTLAASFAQQQSTNGSGQDCEQVLSFYTQMLLG
jgi:hypothetical protein